MKTARREAFPGERFLASALVGLPRNHPARLTGTQVRAWHNERRLLVPFAPLACRVPGFHRTVPFMRLLFTIGVNGVIVQHYFRPSSSHSRPAPRPEFSPARRPRPRSGTGSQVGPREMPAAPWLRGKAGDRFGVPAMRLVDSADVLAGHGEVELHPGALVRGCPRAGTPAMRCRA